MSAHIAARAKRFVQLLLTLALLVMPSLSHGAVGCDLNDPDRDVPRLFQGATNYKTLYLSIAKVGGDKLLAKVEARLGDKFKGLYETPDVPYTVYEIYEGRNKVGYIHGVNHKGEFGGIQVFLALDLTGTIKSFYIQKLTSRYAKSLRDPSFGNLFVGLNLSDFAKYDVVSGAASGKVGDIQNPAPAAEIDFRAAMRAVKKNLILMDEFVLGNRYDTSHSKQSENAR